MEAPAKTPLLGAMPIKFLLMMRRLMYLNHMMKEDKDSMLYRVLQSQIDNPGKGDWVHLMRQDIQDLNLNQIFNQDKICDFFLTYCSCLNLIFELTEY